MNKLATSFFKDRKGRTVLWQRPNALLYGWLILKLLSLVLAGGKLKTGISSLSLAVIFAWAYLEFTKGVNYFRRLLGLVVLAIITLSYFR